MYDPNLNFLLRHNWYLTVCYLQMSCITSDLSTRQRHEKALVWKQDLRVVPLSAFIYLLCYLDRSNIGGHISTIKHCIECWTLIVSSGNAKTLNADKGNDLMTETNISDFQYTYATYGQPCPTISWLGSQDIVSNVTQQRLTGVQNRFDGLSNCIRYIWSSIELLPEEAQA